MALGVIVGLIMIKYLRQPKYPIILGSIVLPVSLGLISTAIMNNNEGQVAAFLALAGAGTGLGFAPSGIHARFSQPPERISIVQGLQLFFRTLGGTIGLTQCATIMNAKVRTGIIELAKNGTLSLSDLAGVSPSASASGVGSIQQIESLPGPASEAIRNVYRDGVRWAFISLIPWVAISAILSVFLSNIVDLDADKKRKAKMVQWSI